MPYKLLSYPAKLLVLILCMSIAIGARGQRLTLSVVDKSTMTPVEFAAVSATKGSDTRGALTDADGRLVMKLKSGQWNISVSALGYNPYHTDITLRTDTVISVQLSSTAATQLGEVVVTAKESKGATSASLIDGAAMEHLQPSSFSDLMELLPGNVTKDPEMGSANVVKLREATNISSADEYSTSSLGTSFVVDGVPINTNADMQVSLDDKQNGRSVVGKGVDMRSLSTDDIEKVEVVRGIPSVEYGEITGGLVNIKRKTGVTNLEARFKADVQSQLFYLGKGIKMPGEEWSLNMAVDYLDSKVDPRNNRENFKRVTGSIRSNKKWTRDNIITTWQSSVNYTGTFERDDNDPDLTINNTIDFYSSKNHTVSWNNTVVMRTPLQKFFQTLTLTQGISYGYNRIHQDKTVASSRLYPMPISTTPGSHYVGYQPMVYDAALDVIGRPFTSFAKLSAMCKYSYGPVSNILKAGVEWNMSKNYGKGQVYDMMRPITAGNTSRPRPFNDIPAMQQLSAYIENTADITLGNHEIEAMIGLRETQLLHMAKDYSIRNKPYLDPRINLKWVLPSLEAAGHPIGWELNGGFGWHTKMPTGAYLYPNLMYLDFAQLNYFHNIEAYRIMNVMTFVEDITNYELLAARNFKWEVRGDINYRGNRLSVTYFREDMNDGFRRSGNVHKYTYNKYDASGFDPVTANRPPAIEELPYSPYTELRVIQKTTNGSRTLKEGVEFTFSSMRIPVIRTRITVNGAWFKTTLNNSQPLWYKPGIVLNGQELQYAGLYYDTDGSTYQSFNTNFVFDTDIPVLKLNFSIAIQNMWFTSTQPMIRNGIPSYYMDATGEIFPYTTESINDPYLKHLVRTYSSTAFDERRIPVETTINFKATKKLWHDRIGVALYVNRLASISPDYYLFGQLRRRYTSPYFGMEINFKL